jgi:hypothetical protein
MSSCSVCGTTYVRAHTCKAGVCEVCKVFYKNIGNHKCPITKCMQFICEGEEVIYTNMVGKGEQCDGCGLQFPVIKNIHGPKQFKGVTLCPDCYDIPEIKKETSNAFRVLLHDDIATRKTGCDICGIILIDAQSAKRVRYFERDHIDPATKTQSVGYMCMRGDPMQVILNENRLCRNLCISPLSQFIC